MVDCLALLLRIPPSPQPVKLVDYLAAFRLSTTAIPILVVDYLAAFSLPTTVVPLLVVDLFGGVAPSKISKFPKDHIDSGLFSATASDSSSTPNSHSSGDQFGESNISPKRDAVAEKPGFGLDVHANTLSNFINAPEKTTNSIMTQLAHDCERKRLFVCCDGTWNNASGTAAPMTNVAKLARAVSRLGRDACGIPNRRVDEGTRATEDQRYGVVRQVVYYSAGIGTQSTLAVDSLFSGAFGKGKILPIAWTIISNL